MLLFCFPTWSSCEITVKILKSRAAPPSGWLKMDGGTFKICITKKTNKQRKNSSYSERWFLTKNMCIFFFRIPFHANNKQWALNQPVLPQHYISCVCAAASVQSCFATFLILLKMLSSLPDWTSPIMVLLLYSLAVVHGLWVANLGGLGNKHIIWGDKKPKNFYPTSSSLASSRNLIILFGSKESLRPNRIHFEVRREWVMNVLSHLHAHIHKGARTKYATAATLTDNPGPLDSKSNDT